VLVFGCFALLIYYVTAVFALYVQPNVADVQSYVTNLQPDEPNVQVRPEAEVVQPTFVLLQIALASMTLCTRS
jgi:hypothetical protein